MLLSFNPGLFFGILGAVIVVVLVCILALSLIAFKKLILRHSLIDDINDPIILKLVVNLMGESVVDFGKYIDAESEKLVAIPHEDVEITTKDGLKLVGRFFENPVKTDKTVLCMHGYTSEGKRDFAGIAQFYIAEGYNVLLPDHRAHGRSEGKYIGFAVLDRFDGLLWLDVITKKYPNGSIVMTGISMGGATVLQMSEFDLPKNVKAIIADCPFTSVKAELSFQLKRLFHLPAFPLVDIVSYICKKKAGYTFDEASSSAAVGNAKVPILFIHGGADVFIPSQMSAECYENCPTEKKLVIVDGAGHGQSHYTDGKLYETSVKEFLKGKF
jgi:alpha-beta hydrolase superfamily lysophospholipase